MEQIQYKGHVFIRDEHCPTCSKAQARMANSTATYAFSTRCGHQKTTVIGHLGGATPNSSTRHASKAEIMIINRDFNI